MSINPYELWQSYQGTWLVMVLYLIPRILPGNLVGFSYALLAQVCSFVSCLSHHMTIDHASYDHWLSVIWPWTTRPFRLRDRNKGVLEWKSRKNERIFKRTLVKLTSISECCLFFLFLVSPQKIRTTTKTNHGGMDFSLCIRRRNRILIDIFAEYLIF